MKPPVVTVIVSTYNRPSILRSALQSVIYQTFEHWQVFVIGDNCDDATAEMIDLLNHPKIKYHNNPLRYGEQSGSNNIGMALSHTKYVALLNHDDVWTPDHLEKAVQHLEAHDTEFYVSNAVFTKRVDKNGFPILKPPFHNRKAIKAFSRNHVYVEPSSSWVFDRELIKRVGFWKHKSEVFRTPIVNYVLRCWRKGVNIHFSENVTCVASAFHHTAISQYAYAYEGKELELLTAFFKEKKMAGEVYLPELPALKKETSKHKIYKKSNLKHTMMRFCINDVTALLYYFSGIDLLEQLNGFRNSRNEMQLSEIRTGESNKIIKPQFSEALALAKKTLG